MLSDSKDYESAEQFLYQCVDSAGFEPDIITTDQEAAFLVAMTEVFGNRVEHRVSKYKNNRLESWHRQPRSRVRPMKSFKNPFRAMVFLHSLE
jgi:transposase-like protein